MKVSINVLLTIFLSVIYFVLFGSIAEGWGINKSAGQLIAFAGIIILFGHIIYLFIQIIKAFRAKSWGLFRWWIIHEIITIFLICWAVFVCMVYLIDEWILPIYFSFGFKQHVRCIFNFWWMKESKVSWSIPQNA